MTLDIIYLEISKKRNKGNCKSYQSTTFGNLKRERINATSVAGGSVRRKSSLPPPTAPFHHHFQQPPIVPLSLLALPPPPPSLSPPPPPPLPPPPPPPPPPAAALLVPHLAAAAPATTKKGGYERNIREIDHQEYAQHLETPGEDTRTTTKLSAFSLSSFSSSFSSSLVREGRAVTLPGHE
ncbi:hypothetical protein V1477_001581 [Vespula maculifrons]|uniref:Uncharacterized protein n=1 Tax=Vespula maculifrons TaxID=7453 RepID=A0ABD2CZM3_VESMC